MFNILIWSPIKLEFQFYDLLLFFKNTFKINRKKRQNHHPKPLWGYWSGLERLGCGIPSFIG
jgi:hypothetical protein